MPNVRSETERKRKLIPYSHIWYGANPTETAILLWDLRMLSQDKIAPTIDPRNLKSIVKKSDLTAHWDRVERDVEDRRRQSFNITVATSATVFEVDAVPANLKAWVTLYNVNTKETAIVASITGVEITVLAPWFLTANGYAVWNVVRDLTTSKAYWINDGKLSIRNDYDQYSNYVQFAEYQVESDLIDNNKSYKNYESNQERRAEIISDTIRDAMLDVYWSFYKWVSWVSTIGWNVYRRAGWLEHYIQWANKVKLPWGSASAARNAIFEQLRKAYQSGISNIYQAGNLVLVCNQNMVEYLSAAFADNITYNDEFKNYNVTVWTIKQNGFRLTFAVSPFLDYLEGQVKIWYLMPIKEVALFSLPLSAMTWPDGRNIRAFGSAEYYKKPITTFEKETTAIWLNRSFIFNFHETAAYQRWIAA